MTRRTLLTLVSALPLAAQQPTSLRGMRWRRRVLLISSPGKDDPMAAAQRRAVSEWKREAADRDVSLVEIAGGRVFGATDTADDLRGRYGLPAGRFQAVLIGKDGHVALRSNSPIPAIRLQATIDAMPMRRAGER